MPPSLPGPSAVDVRAGRAVLRLGHRGAAVSVVQQRLSVPQTGIYDATTIHAVRLFQSRQKLAVDGVVGPETFASLMRGAPAEFSSNNPARPVTSRPVTSGGSTTGTTPTARFASVSTLLPTPQALIDQYTNLFGANLQEEALARDLLGRLPTQSAFVAHVLDALSGSDQDDVSYEIILQATDAQLRAIGANTGGKLLLMRIMRELQDGGTTVDEAIAIERLVRLSSPTHERLRNEGWSKSPQVIAALRSQKASIQSINSGFGDFIYDEYSIVIDAMPPGLTPEAYLAEMARDLNAAVGDATFNRINVFRRAPVGPPHGPAIGDIYEIDIFGPDNGAVMLVEQTASRFVFQTVTMPGLGTHPEYGSREFGFQRNSNGSIMFYTRGASRPSNGAVGLIGRGFQSSGWTAMLNGIGATLTQRGGRTRAGSFQSWTSHRN